MCRLAGGLRSPVGLCGCASPSVRGEPEAAGGKAAHDGCLTAFGVDLQDVHHSKRRFLEERELILGHESFSIREIRAAEGDAVLVEVVLVYF